MFIYLFVYLPVDYLLVGLRQQLQMDFHEIIALLHITGCSCLLDDICLPVRQVWLVAHLYARHHHL